MMDITYGGAAIKRTCRVRKSNDRTRPVLQAVQAMHAVHRIGSTAMLAHPPQHRTACGTPCAVGVRVHAGGAGIEASASVLTRVQQDTRVEAAVCTRTPSRSACAADATQPAGAE